MKSFDFLFSPTAAFLLFNLPILFCEQQVFRPSTSIFDVVIRLAASQLSRANQAVDVLGDCVAHYVPYESASTIDKDKIPVVECDVVQFYLDQLRVCILVAGHLNSDKIVSLLFLIFLSPIFPLTQLLSFYCWNFNFSN